MFSSSVCYSANLYAARFGTNDYQRIRIVVSPSLNYIIQNHSIGYTFLTIYQLLSISTDYTYNLMDRETGEDKRRPSKKIIIYDERTTWNTGSDRHLWNDIVKVSFGFFVMIRLSQ